MSECEELKDELESFSCAVLDFCTSQLEMTHPRDDYWELLELVIIVLGGTPSCGVKFLAPGALHRARWMACIIYAIKIYLFHYQFKLSNQEEVGICRFVLFCLKNYIKAWFQAPLAISAPRNDLDFIKMLSGYSTKDQPLSKGTLKSFSRHLWYRSEELIALSFFDPLVGNDVKIEMVKWLNYQLEQDSPKRLQFAHNDMSSLVSRNLPEFVTNNTNKFFVALGIETDFLKVHPSLWCSNTSYESAEKIVRNLHVTNDLAERGVAMMQEYNAIITNDETQKQFLMQVVEQHRKSLPDCRKKTLLNAL